MTPLERELVDLAKLARPKDIIGEFRRLRDKYGVDVVQAKLDAVFSTEGRVELLTWLSAYKDDPTPEKPSTTPPAASVDAIDVANVRIIGKHAMDPAKATPSATMHSAKIEGGNVRISFDHLGWPTQSSKGKTVDGGVCILWPDGAGGYVGGWFDHHGQGQTVKTLSNIFGGYVDGQKPTAGPVWFYMISYSGKERTNIVRSSNDWK